MDYLRARLGSGEAFDWYYANASERAAQIRRPITDGAYDKPWVFRAKDLVSWWSNRHVERVNGVETEATSWKPQSKPIWLTETDENPNAAAVLFLADGARSQTIDTYALCVELFDGQDASAVAAARERWTSYKSAGHSLVYYQQNEAGRWEEKARG